MPKLGLFYWLQIGRAWSLEVTVVVVNSGGHKIRGRQRKVLVTVFHSLGKSQKDRNRNSLTRVGLKLLMPEICPLDGPFAVLCCGEGPGTRPLQHQSRKHCLPTAPSQASASGLLTDTCLLPVSPEIISLSELLCLYFFFLQGQSYWPGCPP